MLKYRVEANSDIFVPVKKMKQELSLKYNISKNESMLKNLQ